jgi:hypothetical protein
MMTPACHITAYLRLLSLVAVRPPIRQMRARSIFNCARRFCVLATKAAAAFIIFGRRVNLRLYERRLQLLWLAAHTELALK